MNKCSPKKKKGKGKRDGKNGAYNSLNNLVLMKKKNYFLKIFHGKKNCKRNIASFLNIVLIFQIKSIPIQIKKKLDTYENTYVDIVF